MNSGAEAVENAVKVARYFTGRQAILCFEHGFHGRTNLAMALTSKVMPYKKGFGPFAPEVYRIPFPYCYRCAEGPEAAAAAWPIAARLEHILAATVDPGSVAAVIMELELGEGGFVPAPVEYVQTLAAFARQHGILFIADEIQTGFGRTGRMFASEHYGLVPDLITTAKSLAGGLPLAAVTGRADVMEAPQVGGLGGTYGGNPLACAAALAVLDAMEAERIPARAQRTGDRVKARFQQWAGQFACIGDVRGLGAMVGMELVTDRESRTPDKALAGRLLAAALERGLVLLIVRHLRQHHPRAGAAHRGRRDHRRGPRRDGRGARGRRGARAGAGVRLDRERLASCSRPRSAASGETHPRSLALCRAGAAARCWGACRCTGWCAGPGGFPLFAAAAKAPTSPTSTGTATSTSAWATPAP